MKKLELHSLRVESFTTAPGLGSPRGTVLGQALNTGTGACPISYNGSCVISGCIPCQTNAVPL